MKKSFTLIEFIIASFILTTGIGAIYALFSQFIVSSDYAANRLTAIYLAQEGIEIIRNIRDSNILEGASWNEGLINCSSGCIVDYQTPLQQDPYLEFYNDQRYLFLDSSGFYSQTGIFQTKFKRKITISIVEQDILDVKAEVFWSERGRSYNVTLNEKLYNWNWR